MSVRRIPKTFRLAPDLVGRLELAAERRGCSMTDLVEAGLVLALGDPPAARKARRMAERIPSSGGSGKVRGAAASRSRPGVAAKTSAAPSAVPSLAGRTEARPPAVAAGGPVDRADAFRAAEERRRALRSV